MDLRFQFQFLTLEKAPISAMMGFYVSLKKIFGFQQKTFQWETIPWDAGDSHHQKKTTEEKNIKLFFKSFYLKIQITKTFFGKKREMWQVYFQIQLS